MSSVILQGGASGTGSMTVLAPNTNSNQIVTIPDATGTVMVSGNMPAFSVYMGSNQAISNNTTTKIAFDTKDYDTNTNYNTSTYRFTPTVAGYYQISGAIGVTSAITGSIGLALAIQKNGSQIGQTIGTASSSFPGPAVSRLVYLNGSTDYIELYVYTNAGNITLQGGTSFTFFTGALVRAA